MADPKDTKSTPPATKSAGTPKYKYIGPDYPEGKKIILGGAITRKLDPRKMTDDQVDEFLSAYPVASKYWKKS